MSRTVISKIVGTKVVNDATFMISLLFEEQPKPGQFVMVSLIDNRSDPFLPRPISVFDWEDGLLKLLIRKVGRGTELFSQLSAGDSVRVTGYLGNSFPDTNDSICFVGGGIGIAPLFYAARKSIAAEKLFLMGFPTESAVICLEEKRADTKLLYATDDGSAGVHGTVVDMLKNRLEITPPDLIITCGPEGMMKAVQKIASPYNISIFHSLESVMACGIGACLGCRRELPGRSVLVCKDGPIFDGLDIFPEVPQ
ncbi:dihydroorotate dehydrogenase electron transfer subunit [bacterium]|nr:dihydroorotate dehydrogenase electron transfer subunit [bacterium]